MKISILILTLNEEHNLPLCLQSLRGFDDICVFDSYSTDETAPIALWTGARLFQRKFDNYSAHRNWAITNIPFKYPWVFAIDADERMTEELRLELQQVINRPDIAEYGAFRLRYKNFLFGRWIKHASFYPSWITRLFRPERIRYEERLVNAHPIVNGTLGDLHQHFEHYSFTKGFAHWFDKHNRYSTMEAIESIRLLHRKFEWRDLLNHDPAQRRRAWKNLSFRFSGRPLFKFLYMYCWRRGFLDGLPGFTYCMLQAIYEYMIVIKTKELIALTHPKKGGFHT